MRVRDLFILLFFCWHTVSWAQLGFNLKPGQKKVQFPVEIVNNLVIVPVVVNGQLPLKFILDTGVRTTILTEKAFSDILNLSYARRLLVAGPGGEKIVEAFVTNNVTLDMPGIHGQGHAMLVLEKDYLELRNYLGTDVQGILGYEVFSRFVVEIDYEGRRLTISSPDSYRPSKRRQELSIKIEDTKPYVEALIKMQDGAVVKSKLLVDTGASHGLLLEPTTNSLISVPEKHVSGLIGRGIGGPINGKIGRIHSIELGRYRLLGVIANYPDPNNYDFIDTLQSADIFRNGAIGGELLRRFTVTFNFPMEKMYLKKNTSYSKKFNFNLSGLTLKAKGARLRKYDISDVRVGSTAEEAGILIGDELISINGVLASDFSLNELNAVFDIKPGKIVKLEIMRGGKLIVKKVKLISPI